MYTANPTLKSSPQSRHAVSALLALLLGGFALRLYYSWKAYYLTFDSATIGLMALRILEGERPMFFYGQGYMGSLEAYLAALWVSLLGPSDLAVSLAPITFSLLWIVFTYFLFKEISDPWTGVAAAATIALAGYYTLWYCVSNNGGYAPVFALGTLVLWRCVRVGRRLTSPMALFGEVVLIGSASALGLWCGMMMVPYLLSGAVWLLVHLWRSRQRAKTLALYALGALLAALGLLPSILARADYPSSGALTQFSFSETHFRRSLDMLATTNWPRLVLWDPDTLAFTGWMDAVVQGTEMAIYGVLGLAAVVYLLRLGQAWHQGRSLLYLTPLLFVLCFLALYLPHRMSLLYSPRYLIFAWGVLLAALGGLGLASWKGKLSQYGQLLLALYLIYQLVGNFLFIEAMAPKKAQRLENETAVVKAAEAHQLQDVIMTGGYQFGHEAQILTFRAQDRVRFSSPWNERHQPTAQAAEASADYGLALLAKYRPALIATLEDLQVDYTLTPAGEMILAHHISPAPWGHREIPAAELDIRADDSTRDCARLLVDRDIDSRCEFSFAEGGASGFTVDLGKVRPVNGIRLLAPDLAQTGLPLGYRLSASREGAAYRVVRQTPERLPVGYLAGSKVYLEGYYGMLEVRMKPISARYLKIEFTRANKRLQGVIKLAELFIFEKAAAPSSATPAELTPLLDQIRNREIDFVVADRWLSAQLLQRLPNTKGNYPAFPRSNPQRYEYTRLSREVRPRKGLALALTRAVADENEALLKTIYGPGAVQKRYDLAAYRILMLDDPGKIPAPTHRLVWTGHTLLKTALPAEVWR